MDADRTPPRPSHPKPGYSNPSPNNEPPENTSDELLPNSAADDFFVKMNHDFRRPKPSEEAVAAALHAIQTMAGDAAVERASEIAADPSEGFENPDAGDPCPKCAAMNTASNRFCGFCGTSLIRRTKLTTQTAASPNALVRNPVGEGQVREQPPREQHIHHHHHHYFSESVVKNSMIVGEANATLTGELATPPPNAAAAAEAAIQKLVRDWTMCCNSKRLDDLLALYSSDAIVLRANVAPAHGRSAIRLLLQAALQAGLGDVELEPADAGVLGDIACLTGRSRMLVPTAPGKRHEETGKFLIVARRESGDWKILADSWCIDALPKQTAPPTPIVRTPRGK